jgi:hypothetical protein
MHLGREFVWTHRRERLDEEVRRSLRAWPQQPPGVVRNRKQSGVWLKGRPCDPADAAQPFLKLPGSNRLRTLPDGLWLHFGPDPSDPYVDILCIEACGTFANLLDKRSRFAPSTSSLLAYCPVPWLLAPVQMGDDTPRWKLLRLLSQEPTTPLLLPVRDVRVLYGLQQRHYNGFAETQMPQPHEYFCPMEVLMAERGHENPELTALIGRASAAVNFMTL